MDASVGPYFFFLVIMSSHLLTRVFAPCPWSKHCNCSSRFSKVNPAQQAELTYSVNCSHIQLPFVPKAGDSSFLTYDLIDFSFNNISSLQDGTFQELTTALRIVQLRLNNNRISYIHWNAFSALEDKLDFLYLDKNLLTTVPGEAVQRLSSLSELHLSFNRINTFPAMTFQGSMHSLEELKLQNNQLTSIPTNALKGLPDIFRVLDLRNNMIGTLNLCTFDGFPNLQYVKMNGNPMRCTCDLKWLIDKGIKLQISDYDPLYCKQNKISILLRDIQCDPAYSCGSTQAVTTVKAPGDEASTFDLGSNQNTTTINTPVTNRGETVTIVDNSVIISVVVIVIGLVFIAVILAVIIICWMRHKQQTAAQRSQGRMEMMGNQGEGHLKSVPSSQTPETQPLDRDPSYETAVAHDASSQQHKYTPLRPLPSTLTTNNETGEAQYEEMHQPEQPIYQNDYSYCDDVENQGTNTGSHPRNPPEYLELIE